MGVGRDSFCSGDWGMTGMGSDAGSFEIMCSGMSGAISGDDRAVGAVDPAGEGAIAGIILGEAITVEPTT